MPSSVATDYYEVLVGKVNSSCVRKLLRIPDVILLGKYVIINHLHLGSELWGIMMREQGHVLRVLLCGNRDLFQNIRGCGLQATTRREVRDESGAMSL